MQSPAGDSEDVRVLRVFSRLNIGGPSVHVILLTAGLAARGYTTRLVVGEESPGEGNLMDLASERGVLVEQIPGFGREISPLADLRSLVALVRIMKTFQPSIVHTHTAKAGVVGRLAARLAGVPVIVHTYHGHVLKGYFGRAKTAVFRRVETMLARRTTALVAVSETVRTELSDMGVSPAGRIRVIPLGLDLADLAAAESRGRLRSDLGFALDTPLIGIVGRLAPVKDVRTFLAAAALVLRTRPVARFVVVGDGSERVLLQEECRRLGVSEFVRFLGWRRDLTAIYPELDVVVNSSLNEGTPVALIEALAAGKPVVATAAGGTVDLLEGGRFGRLVPIGDAAALAAAVLDTLADEAGSRERARAAREHVLSRYGAERLIRDVDSLYRELLAAAPEAA